jgi:hypothetical protein
MATYTEQLASVQAAIAKIEGGAQEVHLDNRRVIRGDLATLYKREERLMPLAAREAAGRTGPTISRGAGS